MKDILRFSVCGSRQIPHSSAQPTGEAAYIFSSTDTGCITTLQCGKTHEVLQAEKDTANCQNIYSNSLQFILLKKFLTTHFTIEIHSIFFFYYRWSWIKKL